MRVVGGIAKSIKLQTPPSKNVRPTSDKVKEALFNILGSRIEGAYFVDGFAGSGGVGIEALSRGASFAFFIEKSVPVIANIHRNLNNTGLKEKGAVLKGDIIVGLKKLKSRGIQADIIFLDPPYYSTWASKTSQYIYEKNLLSKQGLLIIEYYKNEPVNLSSWQELDRRIYGDTALSLFKLPLP